MKWVLAQVNLLLDNLIKRGRAMVSRCVLHKPGGGGGGWGCVWRITASSVGEKENLEKFVLLFLV